MKRLLFLLLVLTAAVWLGLKMHQDSGYVLVTYGSWSLEMSLWVAVLIVVLAFLTLYLAAKLLSKLRKMGFIFRRWKKQQRVAASQRLTKRGLLALAEGQWHKAEKNLVRAATHSDMPVVNFLAAARAAQEQAHYAQCNDYLQQAYAANPEAKTAISLTQAQLQISAHQWEQALATLTNLLQQTPGHAYVYKLLHCVYVHLNDWQNLLELLPALYKYKVLPPAELERLEHDAYLHVLQQAKTSNLTAIHALWQKIPKPLRKDPELVYFYGDALLALGQDDEAVALLQDAVKRQSAPELIRLYGLAHSSALDKQLKVAEDWLVQQPNNAELLLCLGRLCIANQLWGKARRYLETSLAQQNNPESFLALAKLLESLEHKEEALEYYRQGLLVKASTTETVL